MSDALVREVLRSRLDPALKRVAVSYAHHAGHQTRLVWVSVTTVAKYWGLTRRRVQVVIRELEALGFLKAVRRSGGRRATEYEVVVDALHRLPAVGHSEAWRKPRNGHRGLSLAQPRSQLRTNKKNKRNIIRTSRRSAPVRSRQTKTKTRHPTPRPTTTSAASFP